MVEAREVLAASGVDEAYWRVMPVGMSLSEIDTAMPAFVELVEELGLQFSSAGPEVEARGIVMELVDLQKLTTLTPGDVARLEEAGVVGVREGPLFVASTVELPTADVEPSPSGTNW